MKRMITIAATVSIAACSSHGGNGATPDGPATTGDGDHVVVDAPRNGDGPITDAKATIFTIVLENHDYAEIVGSTNAPYINSLIALGGLATNYKDTNHPSLPNYLHMISGNDQYIGIIDLDPTFFPFPVNNPSVATQLEAANIPWRSYAELESTPCNLTDVGEYAPKHVPFLYFVDQQMGADGLCANTNVDYTSFAADLASNTYRYMWITPSLIDDGHDPATDPVGALTTSDTWLSHNVPAILASEGFTNGGVLFITWDEAEGRNGDNADQIPMIILSPKLKQAGMTSATAYTHSSYLATVEDLLGLARLATVTTTPNMMEFLNP